MKKRVAREKHFCGLPLVRYYVGCAIAIGMTWHHEKKKEVASLLTLMEVASMIAMMHLLTMRKQKPQRTNELRINHLII
jgi:hypothetical protein